ncbi:MAG: hypothetical protein QOF55_1362 [Thermoleophilaceae bacterium]|nr:hypothetical protein [Thermoleophilaceae bacterium]
MGLTRRSFLTRAGLGLAALAAAAGGGTVWELSTIGIRRRGISPTRRRTYVALVDAVGRGSRSQVDPARAAAAADWLRDRHHAAALEPTRRAIEDVLDRLEGRHFSTLDPIARVAVLRDLAAGPESDLAARAVSLAAAPFHPPAGDFHPTPVVL